MAHGRIIRAGGIVHDPQGATGRTEPGLGQQPITRPAYRTSDGFQTPAGVGGAGTHPLLDLSGVPFWRLAFTVAAAAYLGFWFFSLGSGIRIGARL